MKFKYVIPAAFILGFVVFEGSSLLPKGNVFYNIYFSKMAMAFMLGLLFTAIGTIVLGLRMPLSNLVEFERMLNFLKGFTSFSILIGAVIATYYLIECLAIYSANEVFFTGEIAYPLTAFLTNPFVGLLAAAISRTGYHILKGRLIEAAVKA